MIQRLRAQEGQKDEENRFICSKQRDGNKSR